MTRGRLSHRRPAQRLAAFLGVVVLVLALSGRVEVEPDSGARALASLGAGTYVVAAVLVFLEVGTPLGLILPTELVVPLAGAAAATGAVHLPVLVLVVWVAAVTGDSAGYATGVRLGRTRWYRRLSEGRHQRPHLLVRRDLADHGMLTVVAGRFLPSARTLVPLTAGACAMPVGRFLAASATGAAGWSVLLSSLGFLLFASLERAPQVLSGLAAVLAVLLVGFLLRAAWLSRQRT